MKNFLESHELGYFFHPPRRPSEPGYSQIDIRLGDVPSELHFDPEKIRLTVVSANMKLEHLSVEHPWNGRPSYQACTGHIHIIDRKEQHLDAFTFGGEIAIQTEDEHTSVSLKSPAPILVREGLHAERTLLFEEIEVLMAQREAAREYEPDVFAHHLVNVPPVELYLAMLRALKDKYQNAHLGENEQVTRFKHLLRVEIEAVGRLLPGAYARKLEELL